MKDNTLASDAAENTLRIRIVNNDSDVEVAGGRSLAQLLSEARLNLGFDPVCALVNNKSEDLGYRLYAPKTVEFMGYDSEPGRRTYVRSLCMMLYHAVARCVVGARLNIEHSLARGYYCSLSDASGKQISVDQALVDSLKTHMKGLVARNLPFEKKELPSAEVSEIFARQGLGDKVRLMSTLHELYTTFYMLDGIADSYYAPLAVSTGVCSVFDLLPYRDGMLLLGPSESDPAQTAVPRPQDKMFEAFTDHEAFNKIVGVRNVGELNEAVVRGNSPMLINVSEALHNNRIASIADDITRRYREGGARVVMIAGPSSSGKTTFTKRLAIQLMTNLLMPQMISLDDYFVDRHHTPLDASGDYDYESLYALDLQTINDHLNKLIAGQTVELPYYNFETGAREYRGNTVSMGEGSILLIEGIHGLNPELTRMVDERMKYRIYVSALTTISIDDHNWIPTTDNRLLRRIIRDARYRGVSPEQTIRRWPSVRRGEERWIFPFQENADAMFNSSLLFELGVMRQRGETLLSRVSHNVAEYAEASRLLKFLRFFEPISEEFIPSTSLLREFLGGSSFKY